MDKTAVLPDEVLLLILEYLNLKELYTIERTCSRWYALGSQIWAQLNFLDIPGGMSLDTIAQQLCLDSMVSKIRIKDYWPAERMALSLPRLTAKIDRLYCLELIDCEINEQLLRAVATSCLSLKELRIKYFTSSHLRFTQYPHQPDLDAGLAAVFNSCSQLSTIDLHLDRLPPPSVLLALNTEIVEKLHFEAHYYRAEYFEDLFQAICRMSNLRSLKLHFIFDHQVSDWWPEESIINFLSAVGRTCRQLSSVHLNFAEHFCRRTFPLWRFTTGLREFSDSLKTIDLSGNDGLETQDLQTIGLFCRQVEHLSLARSQIGTERALDYLVGCTEMKSLDLSAAKFYSFETTKYHPLSDISVRFLASCPNLIRLNISECHALTMKSLMKLFVKMVTEGNLCHVDAKMVDAVGGQFFSFLYAQLNQKRQPFSMSRRSLTMSTDLCLTNSLAVLANAKFVAPNPIRGFAARKVNDQIVDVIVAIS